MKQKKSKETQSLLASSIQIHLDLHPPVIILSGLKALIDQIIAS